jgi:SAM-dependent methyltransferase
MDSWSPPRSIQVGAGLGAGDVGDEILCRGFWDALPAEARLDVEWMDGGAAASEPYDARHVRLTGGRASRPTLPGLLAGTAARAETMGPDAFLRLLAPRLDAFHAAGQPVDAVGVGFARPESREAVDAFRRSFLPVRSWSVVSAHARDVLRELGVPEERIVLGADWAWCQRPRSRPQGWADALWRGLGVDPGAPLVVLDVSLPSLVREAPALARALDRLAAGQGFQVAFVDSDTRAESDASERTMALMTRRAVRVPRALYTPDQVEALLAPATAVVSARRQTVLQAVLAGVHAIVLADGSGPGDLGHDLEIEAVPLGGGLDPERLLSATSPNDRRRCVLLLGHARRRLAARSQNNLVLWAEASGLAGDPRPRAALVERMCASTWYHRIEIAPGLVTPGQPWDELWEPMRRRHAQADFRGKSVLEVGCWDGYWSFEAERLGAAEVLATDDLSQRKVVTRNVPFVRECLGSRVRYRDDVSVYELPERLGRTFDAVIFYGVLYHLRYPGMALAQLRRVLEPGGVLLLETAVLPDEQEPVMRWGYRAIYEEDPSSWNAVSLPCLRELLTTSYFEVELCETFLRQGRVGRGYARARAVTRLDPDPHIVPDHFLRDVAAGAPPVPVLGRRER